MLDIGYTDTLTSPKTHDNCICLAPIRDGVDTEYKYLWVKLPINTELDKLTTTKFLLKTLYPLRKYYVSLKRTENHYEIWFDTSKFNWNHVGTIVTIVRYLGEHSNYFKGYLKVKEKYPKMKHWHIFYSLHKVTSDNWNHALIKPGATHKIDSFNIKQVIEALDTSKPTEKAINSCWQTGCYSELITIEKIPQLFKNPYFLKKEPI